MRKYIRNNYLLVLIIVAFFFSVAFLARKSNSKPLENIASIFSRPFAGFFSASGYFFADKIDFFRSIGNLKQQNETLFDENLRLKSQLAKQKDIEAENEQLRNQIKLNPREKYNLEAAMIISKEIADQSDLFFIDKGSNSGITEGMAVIVDDGIYIGKIIKTNSHQSQAEFIFSKNSRTSVEVTESFEKGIIQGEFGTSVVLDMVPQTTELKTGDTIITSGLSGLVPRGLLVGYVKDVMPSSDQLFQRSSVILPVDMKKIRIVSVIKSSLE
jgi:rod shape-determining protein MreC